MASSVMEGAFFLFFSFLFIYRAWRSVCIRLEKKSFLSYFQSNNRTLPLHQKIEIAAAMEFSGAL